MIPDDGSFFVILTARDGIAAYMMTKATLLETLDRDFGQGSIMIPSDPPFVVGTMCVLTALPPGFIAIIHNNEDVTKDVLDEAMTRHNRMHNN
jgi:hypothetical protein